MTLKSIVKQRYPKLFQLVKRTPVLSSLARKLTASDAPLTQNGYSVGDLGYLLSTAKAAGLFDAAWYSFRQRRQFPSEQAAFEDYLNKGHFSCVDPSPNFDTELYFKLNSDIYLAGENAMVHYLQNGRHEGRAHVNAGQRWHPAALETTTESALGSPKIALVFHIFYGEFVDYYVECLTDFPLAVDVFVAAANSEVASDAMAKFSKLDVVNKVTVVEVPNRGRNFGPMLVEFGKELLEYDWLCHMHSKKSLYSGRAQTQWADYLGEYLLRDKHVLKQMLGYVNEHADTGIYYPTSFWMMPNWVNHWLKNKGAAKKFCDMWDIRLDTEFLAYPVGGMFWAKPKALKQLFEIDWRYEDFPEEPLPNDGSELHALERMLGLLAEKNGYKQLYYYPTTGEFTHDDTFILMQYVQSYEGIVNQLSNFDCISFDVFDTLVRRQYFVPDYAKLKLGHHLVEEGVAKDALQFVEQRNRAEFAVRQDKKFQGDVNIFEVYQKLAHQHGWGEKQAQSYAELEFAYDLDMIRPKDEMVEIFNHLLLSGKTILVASDTYYTKHQVQLMLRKVGVAEGYRLLVSSDLGMRKDAGTLWPHLKTLIVDGQSLIHVGDNAVADAQIPGDFGIQNFHILNPLDKWHAAGWKNPFAGMEGLDEPTILKWGCLVSEFGRFPFLGE